MQFRHKDNSLWCTSGFYFRTLTVLNIYFLTTLMHSCHSESICPVFQRANQELIIIAARFIANKLSVNLSKTNYILFRSHRKVVSTSDLKLEIDDKEIMQVTSSKFLGVYIDQHLTWVEHISHISKKIAKKYQHTVTYPSFLTQVHLTRIVLLFNISLLVILQHFLGL